MPSTRRMLLPVITIALACGTAALGATLNVPSTHRTLAAALAEARPGDVVEIQPGTYREHDLVVTTGVTIRGLGGQATDVVIDGGGRGRILACENVSGPIILQNLTFRGGAPQGNSTRQQSAGAIFVSRSEIVAQNCRFEDNTAAAHGGAIRFVAASGRVTQCAFVGNRATFGGGAIDCSYGSSPLIERCTFQDNEGGWGGAVSCRVQSSPRIDRSSFTGNSTTNRFGYGGGIFADLESAPRIARCTLTGNQAAFGGALGCFQGSRVVIEGCTVAGNTALGAGAGVYCIDGSPRLTASIIAFQDGSGVESIGLALPELGCSNIYGNLGGDVNGPATGVAGAEPTISADPGFCTADPDAPGALLIASDSPSAGGSCGPMGAWPAGCSLPSPEVTSVLPTVEGAATVVRWTTANDNPGAAYRLTWTRAGGTEREILVEQTGAEAFAGRSTEPPALDADVVFRLYLTGDNGTWLLAAESGYGDGGDGELPTPPSALSVRNWPNPFNPETTIGVTVTRDQRIQVAIYNLEGRRVRLLADRMFTAGEDQLSWNGRDDRGQAMSSGAYVVRVIGESDSRAHKITLLK